ncbi:MAG TPA: BREX system ATP-binding domain-containing protein [Acidimicrobiales bacterium]|nr:BREX system ATP-binding domain-containing protein [Acidimicrobiales bacterium]
MADEPGQAALPSGVVTFMLTDVERSVGLWDSAPDAMASAVEVHDALVRRLVREGDGVLLKAGGEGDATLSVFRRASDAVTTARSLVDEVASTEWPGNLPVRVRVAIHSGEASERGGDYFGPAINRAARIRSLATGGQVLVSNATAELVRDRLGDGAVLVDAGRRQLRGLAREEQVFALGPAHGDADDGDVHQPTGTVAGQVPPQLASGLHEVFVGRTSEIEILQRQWKDASAGTRGAVLIGGEPGIGKTRLASLLANSAAADGAVVLYGRCDADLAVPYQPFVEAIRSYIDLCPADVLRRHAGHGAAELVRLVPALDQRLPELGPPLSADPDTERYALFRAVEELLAGISRDVPVLLVLDDLHWATRPTVLLLRHLVRSTVDSALLIVGTYRDTEVDRRHPLADTLADLRREPHVDRIALRGLATAHVAEVLEAAAGHDLDEHGLELAERLQRETSGNPFFLGAMLDHLAESGALYQVEGRWTSDAATGGELPLPASIRDVLEQRLTRLGDRGVHALTVGAVIGPSFSAGLLEAVADAGELVDVLDDAVQAGLLVELADGYAFAHALVRQAALEGLTNVRRGRTHQRVAAALEGMPAPERHAEALAFHHAGAAAVAGGDKAIEWGAVAARRAVDRLAYEEALAHVSGAAAARASSPGAADDRLLCELYLAESRAHWGLHDRSRAHDAAERAAAAAERAGDANGLAEAAVLHLSGGPVAVAVPNEVGPRLAQRALAALGDAASVARARVLAAQVWHEVEGAGGGVRCLPAAEEAVSVARQVGDDRALGTALVARAAALWAGDDMDVRLSAIDELLEHATRVRDGTGLAEGFIMRTAHRLEAGDLAGVDMGIERLGHVGEDLRSGYMQSWATALTGMRAIMAGRFDEGEALAQEALDVAGGDINAMNVYFAQAMLLHHERGAFAAFEPVLEVGAAQSPGVVVYRAALCLFRAELGNHEAARAELDALSVDGFAGVPRDQTWTGSLMALSSAAAILGAGGHAAVLLGLFRGHAGRLVVSAGGAICLGAADRYLGMLAMTSGRPDEAAEHFRRAIALESRVASPPNLARTRLWYGRLLAADDPIAARPLLQDASATAADLGMVAVAAAANGLLETS